MDWTDWQRLNLDHAMLGYSWSQVHGHYKHSFFSPSINPFTSGNRGVSWGGLWGPGPPGVTKGAPKRKKKGKEKKERGEKRGKKRKRREKEIKKGRNKEQERKKKERKLNQYDERGAMQFQVQVGAPGKKTSGAPNWRRKGREMRHAVSSASRGSREENVRGAKLTEKRTRYAPCSFKCKQGLQRRKRQGRQIDGEKNERGPMQFQVQVGAPRKKTSEAPN